MTLLQNVRYSFLNTLKFSGRAARWEFWSFIWFVFFVSALVTVVNSILLGPELIQTFSMTQNLSSGELTQNIATTRHYNSGWFGVIFGWIIALPLLSLAWRRIQDNNRPGWILLIPVSAICALNVAVISNLASVEIDPALSARAPNFPKIIQMPNMPIDPYVILISAFLLLIPTAYVARCFFRPTQPGSNKYGPSPYETSS